MQCRTIRMTSVTVTMIMALAACRSVGSGAEELLEADQAFAQASLDHGAAEAFHRYLTPDALSLPHAQLPVTGRAAITADMQGDYTLAWEPQHAEVARSGELGWTWGTYSVLLPGGEISSRGKYLNIWRKNASGQWRVAVDMGNLNP